MKRLINIIVMMMLFCVTWAVIATEDDPLDLTPITNNADWTPIERDFDGVTMVLVPPGCFMMGSDGGESDEQPAHEQCFNEPFWIDKYEVTNAQYGSTSSTPSCNQSSGQPLQPRNCVTWFEARDFCEETRQARLPAEAEWEYAARGPDSLIYPWGNAFIEDAVTYFANSDHQAAAVGSRPDGASWVGAADMSGNMWEWTNSLYGHYPYITIDGRERDTGNTSSIYRMLRGGSFANTVDGLYAAHRLWINPYSYSGNIGFRCARSYSSAAATSAPLSPEVALTPVTANADWTPYTRGFGGVRMALVPPGCFIMGSDDAQMEIALTTFGGDSNAPSLMLNEQPAHEICFDRPFWIDRTEVTQADFARRAGIQAQPSHFQGDDRPVESIAWFEARDFCELRGGRLPTEAEWEYAARGPDSLMFPWGDEWRDDAAVWARDSGTAIVGSLPAGASWVGALDMSGNVWEWTSTYFDYYPYDAADGRELNSDDASLGIPRVTRGGAWNNFITATYLLRTMYRSWIYPQDWSENTGFRCARDYEGEIITGD